MMRQRKKFACLRSNEDKALDGAILVLYKYSVVAFRDAFGRSHLHYQDIVSMLNGKVPSTLIIQVGIACSRLEKKGRREVEDLVVSGQLQFFDSEAERRFDSTRNISTGIVPVELVPGERYNMAQVAMKLYESSMAVEVVPLDEPVPVSSGQEMASSSTS